MQPCNLLFAVSCLASSMVASSPAAASEITSYTFDSFDRSFVTPSSARIDNGGAIAMRKAWLTEGVSSLMFHAGGSVYSHQSVAYLALDSATNCPPVNAPAPVPSPPSAIGVSFGVSDGTFVSEGAGVTVTFTVGRSGGGGVVSVGYWTRGGWGRAQAGSDYLSVSGRLIFQPGEYQKTVQVSIVDDNIGEPDEYFSLMLKEPSLGSSIGDNEGIAYIYDDDPGGGGGGGGGPEN